MSNAICKHCKREWLHLGMHDKCPYCRAEAAEAEAEQIKRLREALDDIVCIADPEMYDEGSHSIPLEDCQKLAQEALKEASHD